MNEDRKKTKDAMNLEFSLLASWYMCTGEEEEKKNRMGGDLDMV
jgi:hypothetical protein